MPESRAERRAGRDRTSRLSRRGFAGFCLGGAAVLAVASRAVRQAGLPPATDARQDRDPFASLFGGPFSLETHRGQRVTDLDFRGRFLLVYFGYTLCDDLCPIDLANMAQALALLGKAADRVQPVFISVDPERDTREQLANFVEALSPRFLGLRGSEIETAAVSKAYKVHRQRLTSDMGSQTAMIVDHGSLTYLMGPDGKFRTLMPHNTDAETMAKVIGKYLAQG